MGWLSTINRLYIISEHLTILITFNHYVARQFMIFHSVPFNNLIIIFNSRKSHDIPF